MNIIQIYKQFPKHENCLSHLEKVRWNNNPKCPYCKSTRSTKTKEDHRHHCNACNTTYSVTVGTIFHKTKLDLQKWFLALSLILNAKKSIAARQLSRHLNVNKDTAWRIAMKIRQAMRQSEQRNLLSGVIEMDETYVGGKPRKQQKKNDNTPPNKRGRGTKKTPVVGMVERGGKIKVKAVNKDKLNAKDLSKLVRGSVDISNSVLITDEFKGYLGIKKFMPHETINHQVWYVDGDIHTNTVESFWALLKRGIIGQFHKVSLHHLPKYIDEFCYRHNHRKHSDLFGLTLERGLGV